MIGSYLAYLGYLIWQGLAAAGRLLWAFLRPGLRFISAALLLAALIALTIDITRWQTGTEGPMFQSLAEQIRGSAPATLEAIGNAISGALHPLFWNPLLTSLLALPAWLILLLAGALLGYATRERRQVQIFIN